MTGGCQFELVALTSTHHQDNSPDNLYCPNHALHCNRRHVAMTAADGYDPAQRPATAGSNPMAGNDGTAAGSGAAAPIATAGDPFATPLLAKNPSRFASHPIALTPLSASGSTRGSPAGGGAGTALQ